MSKTKIILTIAGTALLLGWGWYALMPSIDDEAGVKSEKGRSLSIKEQRRQTAKKRESTKIKTGAGKRVEAKGRKSEPMKDTDDWFEEAFSTKIDFSFEEENDPRVTKEIRSIFKDLNDALAGFEPDRKKAYAAYSRLLSKIYANGGSDVPYFVKDRAISLLSVLGSDAASEALGFLSDTDEKVVSQATDALMEQLMDFDAKQSDMLAVIKELAKLNLSAAQCESIMFTIGSFSNSAKVEAALALYDSGNTVAQNVVINNADFVFEEAEAESIKGREDIVQYGKDHPDGTGMDFGFEISK